MFVLCLLKGCIFFVHLYGLVNNSIMCEGEFIALIRSVVGISMPYCSYPAPCIHVIVGLSLQGIHIV